MKLLFVGDVVGSMGREMISEYLPKLKKKHLPDFTIVNGENAASGRGITEKIYKQFIQDGANMVTLGNHAWDNRDVFDFIDGAKQIVRPANFPEGTPGQGLVIAHVHGKEVAVINAQGRTFMPPLDDPFAVLDDLVTEARKRTPIVFVDFHAEATSEKQAVGWFLDGRVSAVIGTHTHVQTADNRILPNGTAFMCDVGMTGPYDEVLGMNKDSVIKRFQTSLPVRFEVPKTGRKTLSACLIDIDQKTGKASKIERILINQDHPFMTEY